MSDEYTLPVNDDIYITGEIEEVAPDFSEIDDDDSTQETVTRTPAVISSDNRSSIGSGELNPSPSDAVPADVSTSEVVVTQRVRHQIDDYEPAALKALSDAGAVFYGVYADGHEEGPIPWTDVYDLDPEGTIIELDEEIASAIAQNFWADTQGVHVTDDPYDEWIEAYESNPQFPNLSTTKNYYNILLNAGGALLRRALNNLVSINRTAISFYDGLGNASTNIMAFFGRNGAQIGRSDEKHVVINSSGIGSYNGDGTVADFTMRGSSIVNSTISGSALVDNTITGGKIANATITGAKIDSGTITNANIANGTITGAKIDSGTITNANIADGTIQGSKIQGSTLTDIPFAAITDAEVEVASIADAQISTATITEAQVENLTTDYAHLQNGVIDNATINHADVNGLSTTYATISNLNAATARIGDLEADHVSVDDFEAEQANIDSLQAATADIATIRADSAKVHSLTAAQLSAATAYIAALNADNITAASLSADVGKIHNLTANELSAAAAYIAALNADSVTAQNIIAMNGDFATVRANAAKVANLTAAQLEADHATVGSLDANYAQINMANVNNAWITNGVIKDGAISSAMINDVSANKLTAGTINGSVINVTNLNADNITTGTINGQRIGEGSLSLDKLSDDVYTEAEVDAMLDTMQAEIDGAIETWTGTDVPTLSNTPANGWTTTAEKDRHVGDVYFVVNPNSQQNGYNYRFTKSGSAYSWQLIKDSDVTNALQRLTTAEGKITTFDSDISQLKTDTGSLTTRTTSLETRADGVDDALLDKVDTTTFNELEDTVDGHTQTLSQHTTAISNKADGSTVTALTNRVSKNEQDISGINTTIGELTTTVESKADGSTVETVSNKLNTVETTVNGHTSQITSINNTLSTKADGSTVSALQSDYATFKQNVNEFESTVGETYATKTELSTTNGNVTALQNRNATLDAQYGYPYQKDIVVYGESNKYYPVYFTNTGSSKYDQYVTHEVMIKRGYAEQGPSDWNTSTHRGSLNLHFGWNYGGWGGATYKCEIYEFSEMYSTLLGDILVGADSGIFSIVYLRGGGTTGAIYHVYSDVPFIRHTYMTNAGVVGENDVPYIGLEQDLVYAKSGDTYQWKVRAPLTSPNVPHLTSLKTNTSMRFTLVRNTLNETQWASYSTIGHTDSWSPNSPTATSSTYAIADCRTLNVGDTFALTGVSTDKSITHSIVCEVTAVPTAEHGNIPAKTIAVNDNSTYVKAIESRVSTAETSITQTNNQIALKANASDVYTKTQTDGLISTEVSNRNSAIEQSADAIRTSVGHTYATKTELGEAFDNRVDDSVEFLYRATSDTEGVSSGRATIEKIKGNTLRWNQLVANGNFASMNGISIIYGTGTVADNVLTATATSDMVPILKYTSQLVSAHKCLLRIDVRPSEAMSGLYIAPANLLFNNLAGGEWTTISQIGTIPADVSNNGVYFNYNNVNNGKSTQFRNFCIFDLTAMFGAGNEPATVAEFEALFPKPYYEYDAGSLLSVNMTGIETTGFNQWDEEWEIGKYSISTGEKVSDANLIRCANPIPVLPSTAYYMQVPYTDASGGFFVVLFYDADGGFLSAANGRSNGYAFTTSSNAHYMAFFVSTLYGTTYNHDICINISDPARNGTYEPYWRSERSIPASTYFPQGMRSAGNVRDELRADAAVTRVGAVDLGTLTWLQNTQGQFFANLPTQGQSLATNHICVPYETSAYGAYTGNVDKSITITGARVWIRDSAYTNKATFKAAMSGVMLHYALATPTTQTIDPPLNLTYKVDSNGTERVMVDETQDAPQSAPLPMDVTYGVNLYESAGNDAASMASIESRVTTAETSIEQNSEAIALRATKSEVNDLDDRVEAAESAITVNAENIESKVSKDGVISSINQSAETVQIHANRVNIEGATIFSSGGRLSDANIKKTANTIPDTRSDDQPPSWYFTNYPKQTVTEFKSASTMGLSGDNYCYVTTVTGWGDASGGYPKQTAQIGNKSYWRVGTSQSEWGAWQESETVSGAESKIQTAVDDMVKRTQRIYYRKSSVGAPSTPGVTSSNWITQTGDVFGQWTAKVPRLTANADGTGTKYLYLYTCEQREMGDGTLSYTTVLLDDSNTIIDGGTIITGSIAANKLDVYDATIGKISTSAINLTGYAQTDDIPTKVSDLTNDTGFVTNDDIQIGGRNLVIDSMNFRAGNTAGSTLVQTVENGMYKMVVSEGNSANWNSSWWPNKDPNWSNVENNLSNGDPFVISFVMRAIGSTKKPTIYLKEGMGYYSLNGALSENWSVVYYTGTWIDNATISPHLGWSGISTSSTYYIKAVKVERGNKPTDWSPAPEDVDADISSKADPSDIPTKVSDLTNDSGFQDSSQVETAITSKGYQTSSDVETAITSKGYATQTSLNSEINQRKAQYGTCSTAAATQAKAVTCSNFELVAGKDITVKFTTANTYASGAVQLNVNSKGAKNVWVANAVTSSSNQLLWGANAYITFRYDGTQFIVIGEPRTWYGASTTAEGTAAKTDTTAVTGCVICKGAKVELAMTNANTATAPTLNIQSTGAKNVYFGNGTARPTKADGTSWLATNTCTFTFDGQYWRTAGKTYIDANSIVTGYLSADRIEAGSLSANKISATSGMFDTANIPTLSSDKITVGGSTLTSNLSAKDSAIADAAKHTQVIISATNVNYVANTCTLTARLYIDGVLQTSTSLKWQWYRDGTTQGSQTTGATGSLAVTSSLGLAHRYACKCTF